MGVAINKDRRSVTLRIKHWKYLSEKAKASKQKHPYCGRYTISTEIERLIEQDIELKKAGFIK